MAALHPGQASLQEVIRGRQVGQWELTEPLGRGGQGTTWRAIWKKDGQSFTRVAVAGGQLERAVVKLMLPPAPEEVPIPAQRFDEWLEREANEFLNEAMALSKIDSPYIPKVYQAARQSTQAGWKVPWFATELISGRSLGEQVGSQGPLDQNQLLDLAHDILAALSAIHGVGLVHLDLKPDNVMLEPGKARLIDFGLVSRANVRGRFGGTPGFFAPEQLDEVIEERDFAPAADIFKLGVTLAIAAGVRLRELWSVDPYGDDDVVRRAMKERPRLGDLKPVVRQVIEPMLEFSPERRPSADASLQLVRGLLPLGNAKGNRQDPRPPAQGSASPQARVVPGRVKPAAAAPVAKPVKGQANIGAKVVVVDRLGLDWTGVVVGLDEKRPGHILIRHEATRGSDNVRSYPLGQVVRGKPLA